MSLLLKILTPQGVVVNNLECDEILVPTSRGELTILEHHTHLMAELGNGILKASARNREPRFFSLTAGVLKVLGPSVVILSVTAESPDQIDPVRAEKAKKRAEEILLGESEALSDEKIIKYRRKRERAETRLRLGNLRGK